MYCIIFKNLKTFAKKKTKKTEKEVVQCVVCIVPHEYITLVALLQQSLNDLRS